MALALSTRNMTRDLTSWSRHTLPDDHDGNSERQFEDEDEVMVIGIDFGTTFSGVAWATLADFETEQINFITTWPGTGREEGKAPTELFYEHDQVMWGYDIPSDAEPVRWFKLLLLKEEDLEEDLRTSEILLRGRRMLRESQKTAVDLIADYLRALWRHVMDMINKSRGESVVDALQFRVVITIPAIWKGYARQGMEAAARQSGILDYRAAGPTKLTFAPEPEAAALSTLCEPSRKVKEGDVYVICDAGGGTVDLISYGIDRAAPIYMSEVVEGTGKSHAGGLCGGVFIDEAFERMCKSRLGRKWDRLSKAGIKELMKGEWEYAIKPQFKPGNANKEYIVAIPAEAFDKSDLDDTTREPLIKNGRIHFRRYHIQKAFKLVFHDIEKLIDAQIRKSQEKESPVTGIILVGGLGGSPYLYEHLKAKYTNISILQSGGMKPRTAICRGAIYKGFLEGAGQDDTTQPTTVLLNAPIKVTSTISRASYGTVYQTPWIEGTHLAEDRMWCSDEGQWKATNQMRWFIRKGDNVSKQNPVKYGYYMLLKESFGESFTVTISTCEDEVPPSRATASVKALCTIDCKLHVPFSQLENHLTPCGDVRKKINYEVEMIPSGATLEFTVKVGGIKLGAQNAQICFQ